LLLLISPLCRPFLFKLIIRLFRYVYMYDVFLVCRLVL